MNKRVRHNENLVFFKWLSFSALLVMLVLKLSGAVDWSWWFILIPVAVWLPAGGFDDFLIMWLLFSDHHHHHDCDHNHDWWDDD